MAMKKKNIRLKTLLATCIMVAAYTIMTGAFNTAKGIESLGLANGFNNNYIYNTVKLSTDSLINNNAENVVIAQDKNSGRVYCIATGRSTLRSISDLNSTQHMTMAWKKAKLDAKVKLVQVIHGIQLIYEKSEDGTKTKVNSEGNLINAIELERNIVNDSIAEVKLKVYLDQQ